MNWHPTASLEILRFRAEVISACRWFFQEQDILEVTTPALSRFATTEPNIESFAVRFTTQPSSYRYLHSSPELPMKRLLAAGSGPIYQISQVFRDSDHGHYHRPEFTLLEWYRPGWDYQCLMREVEFLVRSMPMQVTAPIQSQQFSYRELFLHYLSLDPFTANVMDCSACCERHKLSVPDNMGDAIDPWLDLLLSVLIAPKLPQNGLTFIYDFPISQAALAQVQEKKGYWVAERFELYWGSVELANGFQELTDAEEQYRRFENENRRRQQQNKPMMPIDQHFLAALQSGLPECSGVALGMDRLLMSLSGSTNIRQVIAFADDAHD